MNSTFLAACLLPTALVAAGDFDENSIPDPTQFSVVVADVGDDIIVAGSPIPIESDHSKAALTVIEVATDDGKRLRGVRILLQNATQEDNLYLDRRQVVQLRDEFTRLDQRFESDEKCGAIKRCIHGVARCRPSQTVRQAFCPGFYSTPDGDGGVVISTPHYSFQFPSLGPSVFVGAADSVIGELSR